MSQREASEPLRRVQHRSRETCEIVGHRIRELRKVRRMALRDLSQATGLSVGYLSQLERNLATPSIRALSDVARALEVGINWFFPDPEAEASPEAATVVRGAKRRALRFASGIKDELLSPSLSGALEMLLCTFEPGASSGEKLYEHEGEEAGYVAEGQLEITIEERLLHLQAGDSFQFESRRPHRYRNPGPGRTVVVWAMTPPRY